MHLVSRALAWVTAMLFGPPDPSRAAHVTTLPRSVPSPPTPYPSPYLSPEIWAAILASARRRRAPRPWSRSAPPAISADDITSSLVGIYLLLPEVRQRALAAALRDEEAHR